MSGAGEAAGKYPLLDSIAAPEQIRQFTAAQLEELSGDVRRFLIDSISETGGHFASNLGTVELTVAIFNQFDLRSDRVLWDVGHQAYPHKILTGRKERFKTLRQHHGLSGFLKRDESPVYDHFGAGHASTSISAALGMAKARDLKGEDHYAVAVIGDGSMTAGMAFEALNQAGYLETKKFLVILNDNDMSINPNVGSLQGYLNQLMSGQYYNTWRDRIEHAIKAIPLEGVSKRVAKVAKWSEESMKRLMVPGLLFEDLGLRYMGPVNGHDVNATAQALAEAKEKMKDGPVLLHVQTKKGYGYEPAVKDPLKWHGVTAFDAEAGEIKKGAAAAAPAYTKVFAEALIELAKKDEKIVAITAAMLDGTGLNHFQKAFPERTFDVGIAEQHAVTFAAGLAAQGMRPVVAIYSTFLQRGFDQVAHDVCIQNLPVTFAMDRAGIVGADGPTHHGLYDMAFLRCLPNIILMAPKDENELRRMVMTAVYSDRPAAVRYPRGNGLGVPMEDPITALPIGKGELLCDGSDLAIIACGSLVHTALKVAETLAQEGVGCSVVNARFIKPLDHDLILGAARKARGVVALEEGCEPGGFTSAVLECLADGGVTKAALRCAVPDHLVHHGDPKKLMDEEGLSQDRILARVRDFLKTL
ncbi:MAG TPA: 1-deoxy-D-xylulose-5-phosphate synthase [Holophagaceae bacterium]|nr:1-deoxy-D-xylulose-5-phosphate synthase [Holophagaceae bacterium]